jgi:hypothetical protein
MRVTTTVAALAALLCPTLAGTADSPLAPLAFLAGHCWTTDIDGGRETDTHCYEWMHGGQQLRDRHVVRGDKPDYLGETVYAWNGERKRVEFRYWNSLGGQSDGYLEVAADGTLKFLDDRYVGPDGVAYVFASEMTRPAEGEYRILTRYREGDAWKDMWTRHFRRAAAVPALTGSGHTGGGQPPQGGGAATMHSG